jgi:arabinofuranan 3-O-arabinosyltransferase
VKPIWAADPEDADRQEKRRSLLRFLTVALWVGAVASWVVLFLIIVREHTLGWDILISWHAEQLFVHGGEPYSVGAFVYPPSSLVLLAPLDALNRHQLTVGGLVVTALIAWASVLVSARAIGIRLRGPATAGTLLVLSLVGAMRGEMPLENVSVLEFLALALFFLFALRSRWLAAGVVIGLAIAIKPLLLPVLVVFVLAKRWKGLGAAVAVPVALNLLALAFVRAPGQVFSKLPSLFDRTGSGVVYNSAWVDVARLLGLPEGVSILLRVVTAVMVVIATWLAWRRLEDPRLRIIVSTSVLLIGAFLAGTLSEYHFMLTLVPLCMTVFIARSPMRSVVAGVGMAWVMDALGPPAWLFGLSDNARDSVFRAIGMGLVLVSFIVTLARRRPTVAGDDAALPVASHGAAERELSMAVSR